MPYWGRRYCDIDAWFDGVSDKPDDLTSTWRRTTTKRDRNPCPRWNSNPQSHQVKHRNLPFRYLRTTGMSLSYSSASISCRLSGLIKNTEFRLSKTPSSRQKADRVTQFLTAAGSVWRTHTVGSPSSFGLTPKAGQRSGISQLQKF